MDQILPQFWPPCPLEWSNISRHFAYYLPFYHGTPVDFCLTPTLLVHVVIECPLTALSCLNSPNFCLVLLQVAKCFVPVQNFCVGPKIFLHIVPVTNILCQAKRWFAFSKIGFCAGTKVFEEALNAVKFLGWLKKFGPAQNILRPVKGQGISRLV